MLRSRSTAAIAQPYHGCYDRPVTRSRAGARRTRRGRMRNGFCAYDSDTHVNPAAEVLDRYVDPSFRARLPELEPYRLPSGTSVEGGSPMHQYRVGTKLYRRVLGEKAPRDTFTGRDTRWRGTKMPRPGIQDDQPANRVADMDDEGVDTHFLIPTSWLSVVGLD